MEKKYKPTLPETARLWRKLLYNKIENIFVYDGLPEEIPVRFFNLCLFKTGKVVFYKINGKYCVQPFSYNDILNWYYVPVKGRVVNPYLPTNHQNWEFTVDDEAVIYNSSADIYNYRQFSTVADLIWKTANQLSENDISYYCISRNSRLLALFSAETDLQKREMDRILDKMYRGEADITMEENLVSHIHANPLTQNSTRNTLTELIEFQQYILANFYHSFGINSNYNLKREQLNSDEIDVNQEVLRLNIEDMLKNREDGVEKINSKYGLNVSVSLNEKLYATLLQLTQQVLDPSDPNQTSMEEGVLKHDSVTMAQKENENGEENKLRTEDISSTDSQNSKDSEDENGERMDGISSDKRTGSDSKERSEDRDSGIQSGEDDRENNKESVLGDSETSNGRGTESTSGSTNDSEINAETSVISGSEEENLDDNGNKDSVQNNPVVINTIIIEKGEDKNDDNKISRNNEET